MRRSWSVSWRDVRVMSILQSDQSLLKKNRSPHINVLTSPQQQLVQVPINTINYCVITAFGRQNKHKSTTLIIPSILIPVRFARYIVKS